MRLASHILALFLAITSIAAPCLAKVQTGYVTKASTATGAESIEADNSDCKEPCIKAIAARPDVDRTIIVKDLGSGLFSESSLLRHNPPAKLVGNFKPPNPPCDYAVDLFVLCRQLN